MPCGATGYSDEGLSSKGQSKLKSIIFMDDETLNQENFMTFAEGAVKKYDEMGMIADAMLWGRILTHFKVVKEIADNAEAVKSCEDCKYNPCGEHDR